jgi:hypothetical protein
MEFLSLLLLLLSSLIVWLRPAKEQLAWRLLVASAVLMVLLFELGTRTSILPGLNY